MERRATGSEINILYVNKGGVGVFNINVLMHLYTEKTDSLWQPNLLPIEFGRLQELSYKLVVITEYIRFS